MVDHDLDHARAFAIKSDALMRRMTVIIMIIIVTAVGPEKQTDGPIEHVAIRDA